LFRPRSCYFEDRAKRLTDPYSPQHALIDLYLLELMVNGIIPRELATTIKELNVGPAMVSETDGSLGAFPINTNRDVKWTDTTTNSWTSKCECSHRREMTA
jgi:hypothetical protein